MFLPMTPEEMRVQGIDRCDVILVSGDAYIDAPHIGVAVVGRVLQAAGFTVGIVAQPRSDTAEDILRLGEPRLFWGVSAGSVDSMVANYTALMKKRRSDDYTPGGENTRRPDRACIVYANLIRRFGVDKRPIVLGGIEASLRRIAHYDYWDDAVRRSLLFDAKADILVYGMGEGTVLGLARRLREGAPVDDLAGTCVIAREAHAEYITLPAYEDVRHDATAFTEMFRLFYDNLDPRSAKGLQQRHGDRWLRHHPPAAYESQDELDRVYALPFERDAHPRYRREGALRALDTIRFSLQTHRGCYGECNFCAIAVHEGRTVRWRSEESVLREAGRFAAHPAFRGVIPDVGGPTANMYGYECAKKLRSGACRDQRCMFPTLCASMPVDHSRYTRLLGRIRALPAVRHVFVASGIRHDLVMSDTHCGEEFLRALVEHHVSGQLRLAPEHADDGILALMGKGSFDDVLDFRKRFFTLTRAAGKKQQLSYYFIAAYPGCGEEEMRHLRKRIAEEARIDAEHVQVFTPTPSTWASVMYHTGRNPFTGETLFVERGLKGKRAQKESVLGTSPGKTTGARGHGSR